MNSMYVPVRKINAMYTYRDRARASSEINHPGHRIGGLLAERLDRGAGSTPWDNSTKRITSPKARQRRRVRMQRTPKNISILNLENEMGKIRTRK